MRISPFCRKIRASPNCSIQSVTVRRVDFCAAPRIDSSDFPAVTRDSSMKGKSQTRARSIRIVALGGGTGLSTVLRGLKEYVTTRKKERTPLPIADLAAVVTVTDDGGSSGRLRREYRVLPPGDIRNCMVALSKDEDLLGKLFQYRFPA